MISAVTGARSIPPACWKYVNCVISIPSMTTCQPTPQAPSVGDSQLSSSNRTSCSARTTPRRSRLRRYISWTFSGEGFKTTWSCVCLPRRIGFSPYRPSAGRRDGWM